MNALSVRGQGDRIARIVVLYVKCVYDKRDGYLYPNGSAILSTRITVVK